MIIQNTKRKGAFTPEEKTFNALFQLNVSKLFKKKFQEEFPFRKNKK